MPADQNSGWLRERETQTQPLIEGKPESAVKSPAFVPLHVHSTFSLLDGVGMPAQMAEVAYNRGLKAFAITDHGNTTAHPRLEQAAKLRGMKPLYGCEFYLGEEGERKKSHITVIAKNLEGYRNMMKLVNLSYKPERFYYLPTIWLEDLFTYQEGLVVLSGCQQGLLSQAIIEGRHDEAEELVQQLNENLDDFYIEIQPFELEATKVANEGLIRLSEKFGIPLVATNDTHYMEKGDEKVQQFIKSIKFKKLADPMTDRCYIATGEDMLAWGMPWEAIENSQKIADSCDHIILPKVEPVKSGVENPDEVLLQMCRDGWVKRRIYENHPDDWEKYRDRVLREVEIISDKQYSDYFLIISELVQWAKAQGIVVGPARGSAAASLVAYLIEITEVDPLRWDLLLERFVDPNRYDYPDIDLDFAHNRRDEVKAHVHEKYGSSRVANIAGYSSLKPKALLDDLARVYGLSKQAVEEAKKDLEHEGGTMVLREVIDKHFPELSFASKAEDMVRQLTVHAAGMLISSEGLEGYVPVGRDNLALLDHRDAEYLGFIKLDILSLRSLTVIDLILKRIGKDTHWLYTELGLDDELTYEGFCQGDLEGVFQFEGSTVRRVNKLIQPRDFQELCNISALSRPIPIQTGSTDAYVAGHQKEFHPIFTEHTKISKGHILYQEQIMKLLRELGGISWDDTGKFRKYISKYKVQKSEREEKEGIAFLLDIRTKFLNNFTSKYGDKELGIEIWEHFGRFGGYGFNQGHAVSYTLLSYYTMYLKKHYPLEFYWANMVNDPDSKTLLREYLREGGKVYGVKWGKGGANWTIDKGGLRVGYLSLKGIGPVSAKKIEEGVVPKGTARKVLEEAGAFDEKDEPIDYFGIDSLQEKLDLVKGRQKIAEIEPGNFVRIAGKVEDIRYTNLKKLLSAQGRNYYDDVKTNPENSVYMNLELVDETGVVTVNVNRNLWADITIRKMFDEMGEGDALFVFGQYSAQMNKVYASKLRVI